MGGEVLLIMVGKGGGAKSGRWGGFLTWKKSLAAAPAVGSSHPSGMGEKPVSERAAAPAAPAAVPMPVKSWICSHKILDPPVVSLLPYRVCRLKEKWALMRL